HPLAEGSEAYYTYESGDSATFRLPDGSSIRLRELKVRPRVPKWNLAVGSLWFDLSGGQLVRAAYRMSVPMDIKAVAEEDDSASFEDVPKLIKPMLFPMTASVSAIGVEYGLYQGRFWLPRVQVLEGGANVSFMRVPFKLEQKFEYDRVNAGQPLPPIPVDDSTSRRANSGVQVTVGTPSRSDSSRAARRNARRKQQCDSTGFRTYTRTSESNPDPILTTVTCDSLKLANSPDLPGSIYDKGDETFSGPEIDDLVKQALSMNAQADFAPLPPTGQLDNVRYNRIEGLSFGARVDQQLGMGYSLHADGRFGVADRQPVLELTASRSDLRRTLSVTAYNRLVSASDWGNPLTLGSSISAFLFGRDEGFYYRASGVELTSLPDEAAGGAFIWSLFAEQERTAKQKTTFSLARVVNGAEFEPNFEAQRGTFFGARTRYMGTLGLDPQGFRLFTDVRLEGAHADTGAYGRAALDLTASHGIGDAGAAALTVAAGTSAGILPAQRFWYLGGSQTVRGQRPGREVGDAFWLARAEIARGIGAVRPVIFGDFGWAGNRNDWSKIGLPMSGAGAGMSILDGLIRFDVARGINPERQWRVDTYIEARF
ncbi:MAG: ShlB/FhaC/HecB family hemolysin secretion/activation protein, partial [Gemmatimonadaceae bacterium]